jgi:hypothetical protein
MEAPPLPVDSAAREWAVLQPLYERYEFGALTIKLVAVVLMFTGIVVELHAAWLLLLIAVLWLQEGIFKTFQARLGARLLALEQGIGAGAADAGFALHRDWQARRKSLFGLLREYLASALRPTVAFPYLVLLMLVWFFYS